MNPFVNIHTHSNRHTNNKDFIEIQSINIDEIVNIDASSFLSVGVHPWDVDKIDNVDATVLQLENLLTNNPNVLAIGETGIDRLYKDTLQIQEDVFLRHIQISESLGKPLIIHAVRSYSDIISIKKRTKAKSPWVIHGFQGDMMIAKQLLPHNIYLSLFDILFRNERKAHDLLTKIPIDKFFFETDTNNMSIVEVYKKASSIKGVDIDIMRDDIFSNFVKIFGEI